MPFALLFVGLLLLIAGVRNQHSQLLDLVKQDFTGSGNFVYWVVALLALGALGYIPRLKPFSIALIALVIVVLFLSNKGFFAKFSSGINTTATQPAQSNPQPTNTTFQVPSLGALFPNLQTETTIA